MNTSRNIAAVGFSLMSLIAFAEVKLSPYPPSRRDAQAVEVIHGVEIRDPYRWLENADNPEVKAWTDQQNAYTRSLLNKLPGRDRIHRRLEELLEIGRISAPQPVRGKYLYTKREGKQNQPILYVRDGLRGTDRVLIDPNQLSADGTTALDWWHPNRDGTLVAYGLSTHGSEESILHVRDVGTGKDLPDRIERTRAASIAWMPHIQKPGFSEKPGFYYTRYPKPGTVPKGQENYFRHVYFHALGTNPANDPKVFGEGRAAEDWPEVALSPDGHWLLVNVHQGWSRNEVYLKNFKADAPFVAVAEKIDAIFDPIIRNDVLYIRSNQDAPRYRVFKVNPSRPHREHWSEIIPERADVLENLAVIADQLVCLYLRNASSQLQIYDSGRKSFQEIALPTLGTVDGLGGEWDGNELLYSFNSFTVPPTIYHLDLKAGKPELWQRVQSDLDVAAYEIKQVRYPSKDGTPVSMFLAHRKGLKLDGNTPAYLTGYGGFNISRTPVFAASWFLFLERGGVIALANLRGGAEYGEAWHRAGMLDKKQNVFDDFIAAAEWLTANGYTNPQRLAIEGRSNGGLLIGAAITQRPELFRAAVCGVPLLDMLRYHKFRIAKLWIPEYGDPEDAQAFHWLKAYSPYHRVKEGVSYPAMLITAAESDTRVDPMHARKMTALLQTASGSKQPIFLRLETKAGHGAGKPRAKVVEELADTWSFLFWQLNL